MKKLLSLLLTSLLCIGQMPINVYAQETLTANKYAITDGANAEIKKGNKISFTTDVPVGEIKGIKVDGALLNAANYTITAASNTVITFSDAYSNTLSVGNHTFAIVLNDESLNGYINVEIHDDVPATYEDGTLDKVFVSNSEEVTSVEGSIAIQNGEEVVFDAGADELKSVELVVDYGSQVIAYSYFTTNEHHTTDSFAEWDGEKVTLYTDTDSVITIDLSTGNYVYKFSEDAATHGETLGIQYTITDGDDDSSSATTKLNFVPVLAPVIMTGEIEVKEENLPDALEPDETMLKGEDSFLIDLHGDNGILTIGYDNNKEYELKNNNSSYSVNDTFTVKGVDITVVKISQNDSNGEWTVIYHYVLREAQIHDKNKSDEELHDILPIKVEKVVGSNAIVNTTADIKIKVYDDGPILDLADTELSTSNTSNSVNSHVDFWYGADFQNGNPGLTINGFSGTAVTGGTEFVITGVGTVLLKLGGDFTFTGADDVVGEQVLTFVVTDGDGDTDSQSIKITVLPLQSNSTGSPTSYTGIGNSTFYARIANVNVQSLLQLNDVAKLINTNNNTEGESIGEIQVDESALPDSQGIGSFNVKLSKNDEIVSVDIVNSIDDFNAVVTSITQNGTDGEWTVSYQYGLSSNQYHDKDNGQDEIISIKIPVEVSYRQADVTTNFTIVEKTIVPEPKNPVVPSTPTTPSTPSYTAPTTPTTVTSPIAPVTSTTPVRRLVSPNTADKGLVGTAFTFGGSVVVLLAVLYVLNKNKK